MRNEPPKHPGGGVRLTQKERRRRSRSAVILVLALILVAVLAVLAAVLSRQEGAARPPAVSPAASPGAASSPPESIPPESAPPAVEPSATPASQAPEEGGQVVPERPRVSDAPTPEPYDFTQFVPESEAADESWFDDAVFLGDSRTDGLKLYGGIKGASYVQATGITVFEVNDPAKKVIKVDGKKYTAMEALALKQYGKVYVMLGVNELGYFDDDAFRDAYSAMVDHIRKVQPGAVIYLQNLVRINPEKAKANSQPYYVTNEQIDIYNEIIAQIANRKHALLLDVNGALTDDTGVLPQEGTTDGVHFSKDYCKKWHAYLLTHTVDPERYWAGQTAEEGASEI